MPINPHNIRVIVDGTLCSTVTSVNFGYDYQNSMVYVAGGRNGISLSGENSISVSIDKIFGINDIFSNIINNINDSSQNGENSSTLEILVDEKGMEYNHKFYGQVSDFTFSAKAGEFPTLNINMISSKKPEISYSRPNYPEEVIFIPKMNEIYTSIKEFDSIGYVNSFSYGESKKIDKIYLVSEVGSGSSNNFKMIQSKDIIQNMSIDVVSTKSATSGVVSGSDYINKKFEDIYAKLKISRDSINIEKIFSMKNCKLKNIQTIYSDSDFQIFRFQFEGVRKASS